MGEQMHFDQLLVETPIQKLNEKLNNNTYYIKRDDLLPIAFGGNKARKAALFFDDLKGRGADCVVTYGSSSSNHCRIVANIASGMGIPCYVISPNVVIRPTVNAQLIELAGAQIVRFLISEVRSTIEFTFQRLQSQGYKPYFIQGGGHGNLGTRAYVDCYDEIVSQEREMGLHFDYIFLASGTGTTQAGLICGRATHNDDKNIIGISIARKNPHGRQVVAESVREYMQYINGDVGNQDAVIFVDDYIVDGYGSRNKQILEVISRVLRREGMPLDATYTGKAFWGMLEYVK